jgi:hypothetical protein
MSKGSSRVISHVLGSVKECERINLHILRELPFWEWEFRWTFEFSKSNYKSQIPID